jgi:hypothetical protein
MISTTTQVLPDFLKNIVTETIQTFTSLPLQSARFVWSIFISILKEHWLFLLAVFFVIVVVATIKFMFGRWGMLGSVIYNSVYFGILLIIGLIWGPDIFVHDLFKPLCLIILYPVCYWITSKFLIKFRT